MAGAAGRPHPRRDPRPMTDRLRKNALTPLRRHAALCLALASGCSSPTPPPTEALPVVWQQIQSTAVTTESWDGIPAVAGGRAVFETNTGLLAVRVADGDTIWQSRLWSHKQPTAFNVAVGGERVFVNELDSVFAVSLGDGRRLWARDVGAPVNYHHTFAIADLVLTTTYRPSVVAMDAATGATRWELTLPPSWDSGGIITGLGASGDTLYVAANEHFMRNGAEKRAAVIAADRASGRVLWTYRAADRHSSAGRRLAVSGRTVLVADMYGNGLFGVDRFTGQATWRVNGEPGSFGPDDAPLVLGDTAFIGSNDRFVYAVAPDAGTVYWRRRAGGSIRHFTLCGPYVLANQLAVAIVPRDAQRPVRYMLHEQGVAGYPTSGFAVVDDIAVVATSRGMVAMRCI